MFTTYKDKLQMEWYAFSGSQGSEQINAHIIFILHFHILTLIHTFI